MGETGLIEALTKLYQETDHGGSDKMPDEGFLPLGKLKLTEMKQSRGGVILTTLFEGVRYLGFGRDWDTGDATDFAGGISYSTGARRLWKRGYVTRQECSGGLASRVPGGESARSRSVYSGSAA